MAAEKKPDIAGSDAPKGRVIRTEAIQISPTLQGSILASPFQRAGGMALDLVVVAALSSLAGPILGIFTGLTLASLGSRKVSDARFWLVFRWVLIALGAVVMALSAFLLAGSPLLRTEAFNISRQSDRAAETKPFILSQNPSNSELRRALEHAESTARALALENRTLREREKGRSWLNLAADFGTTLGLTFGWAGVYFTLCTAWLKGRTPGKFLMGTRVACLNGRPITPMDAFIRNGGYAAGLATGSIGFLSLLWHPNRQAIHDRIASTVVVRTR